jgi:hypothetical protein
MRDAINDIGQHLCESNGLKLRWEGIKGLDGDVSVRQLSEYEIYEFDI